MSEEMLALFAREEALCDELVPHVVDGCLGKMIHHPLAVHIMFDSAHCGLINEQFRRRSEALNISLAEKKLSSAIFMHERPYRFGALIEYMQDYDFARHPDFWETVGNVWTDSENIYESFDDWQWVWEIDAPNIELVMDEDERTAFAALPETLEVYRGVAENGTEEGMSWTIDRNKAVWFAKRFNKSGTVLFTTINKCDVMAHFLGRNETEIVVMPQHLGLITKETV